MHDGLVHVFPSISVDPRQVGRLTKEAEHQVYTFVPVLHTEHARYMAQKKKSNNNTTAISTRTP